MRQYFFIKDNKKLLRFIIYPLVVIFFINFIFFIVASIYDYQIMNFFARFIKNDFLKYLSIFYHELGFTELYIAFLLAFFIIFEYVWFFLQKKHGFDKDKWSWWTLIFLVLVWVLLMFWKTYPKWEFNYYIEDLDGNKIQYNLKKMISAKDYRGILIFVACYQFIVLMAVLLYAKLVFIKKPNFYEKEYWAIGIKIIAYFFITYGLVGTLKVVMGRDYYVGIEDTLIKRLEIYHEKTGVWIKFPKRMITSPDGYQPWWIFNGLIGNPSSIDWSLDKLFNNNAFPSGHMAQMAMTGVCFFFIIDPKDSNSLTKYKIASIYLFFVHQLLMVITFLINGSHWLTDTSFTWMWSILSIYLCNVAVDKSINNYLKNKTIKKIRKMKQ